MPVISKSFSLSFCAVLVASSALAGNVLTNPGFELGTSSSSGLLYWTTYGANNYNEGNPSIAHSGTNYYKVYQNFNGVTNYTGIYQDYISGPGANYAASGWAFTTNTDVLAGHNVGWIEVTFRDVNANVLALYRSSLINTNAIKTGSFPTNTWVNLAVTNQYDPNTLVITNRTSLLVAPAGTYFVRYEIKLQGDPQTSANGSLYFDDLVLNQSGSAPYGNWNIVWSDEFNGTTLNPNVWTFDTGDGCSSGNCGWGNKELENYTSTTNNAYVAGGLLHIVALHQPASGTNYTSARIKSEGLFSFKYGRVEWRASLPQGIGFWPALWMLGNNIDTGTGWPGCGEVDVMENNGNAPGMVQGSLHSGSDETLVYDFPAGGSVTNFHTYTLDWATNAFLFYVDGYLYESQTNWGTSVTNQSYPFPFNQPFFFIMNLAIGGNYVGNPSTNQINSNTFPAQVLVDYVRIYNQTAPLKVSVAPISGGVQVSWPSNIVCHLQKQVSVPSAGLGSNWLNVVTSTNHLQVTPANGSGYYRLESP